MLAPFFDGDFLEHLNGLCRDGLSRHGEKCLIGFWQNETDISCVFIEVYFEYMRYRHYASLPSRLQSFYVFDDYISALKFGGWEGKIYEVSAQPGMHKGDTNCLKYTDDARHQEVWARKYWEGVPFINGEKYAPKWEYLLPLPVEVGKLVKDGAIGYAD